jgi:hypothetical protein
MLSIVREQRNGEARHPDGLSETRVEAWRRRTLRVVTAVVWPGMHILEGKDAMRHHAKLALQGVAQVRYGVLLTAVLESTKGRNLYINNMETMNALELNLQESDIPMRKPSVAKP